MAEQKDAFGKGNEGLICDTSIIGFLKLTDDGKDFTGTANRDERGRGYAIQAGASLSLTQERDAQLDMKYDFLMNGQHACYLFPKKSRGGKVYLRGDTANGCTILGFELNPGGKMHSEGFQIMLKVEGTPYSPEEIQNPALEQGAAATLPSVFATDHGAPAASQGYPVNDAKPSQVSPEEAAVFGTPVKEASPFGGSFGDNHQQGETSPGPFAEQVEESPF